MSDLSVRIITWNVGDSPKHFTTADQWTAELKKWPLGNDDIIFITLQETSKELGSKIFADALIQKLDSYKIFYEGEGPKIGPDFYVFSYLCVKKSITIKNPPIPNNKKDKTIDAGCIYKFGSCTKPSVGIGAEINGTKLVFVGSHLPINTKDKENASLGYAERIDAIQKMQKEVIQDVENAIGGSDVVFWTGDFNMRVQTDGMEQLEIALKKELSDFTEPDKTYVRRTCRIKEKGETDDLDTYIKTRLSDDDNKFDTKRKPSYCDRVIYRDPGRKFKLTEYYSWPKANTPKDKVPDSIVHSDHDMVVLVGTIETQTKQIKSNKLNKPNKPKRNPVSTGGSFFDKYMKYKTKYLALKMYAGQ